MKLSLKDINELDRVKRLNLINSITGIKPANLIGTKSTQGSENLAIFSSVVHLGSNPPLIGMITRPLGEVPRHTYENIKSTGFYTINAVPEGYEKQAHYTSAKFDRGDSEFDACGFSPEYLNEFAAPFVQSSPIKLGLQLVEEQHIKINGTILLIGEIQYLDISDEFISPQGYINLTKAGAIGISGLNSYYQLTHKADYPYARKEEWNAK